MWDCFAIDGTIDKMQCWKIRLQLFIFFPLKIFNSETGQITFPKWPFCKNLSLVQTSIMLSLFSLSFQCYLFIRWGPELDGWSVFWFGFILCCCWEEERRPPPLCAIFSGLQVPGTWQPLQVSLFFALCLIELHQANGVCHCLLRSVGRNIFSQWP